MKKNIFNFGTKIRILACVDSYKNCELSGRIYMPLGKGVFAFHGIIDFLKYIEKLCDAYLFPQVYFQHRTYSDQKIRKDEKTVTQEVLIDMDENIFLEETGEKATFMVQVMFRQNATWQGSILWSEQNKTQHFRSALEMIKLMDDALALSAGNKDEDTQYDSWD